MSKIAEGFDEILQLLSELDGINVIAEESQVQSADDITMHKYLQLKKLDFDYMSFLNGEEGSTADEILL